MFCKLSSLVFPWFLVVNVQCPKPCKAFSLSTDPLLEGAALKLASFNVQVFGAKKMENKLVENVLIKTILRYDIILIQEIRSLSDESITALLEGVNRYSHSSVYQMALSARLGRTNSKEQYAFLYRSDKLTLIDSYVYDDGDENTKMDKFQREPFIVRFKSPTSYVSDFAMIAIHTSPSQAVSEIDRLVDVYDDVLRHWNLRDVIILGDFNSGCSYVTRSEWIQIRLATDKRFYWLFSDDVDTTVAKSDCPYDRMVVAGRRMAKGIFADTAKVFRFDVAFNLTQEEAEKVSDHWPIEVQFKDITFRDEEKYFEESVSFTNEDKRMAQLPKTSVYALRYPDKNQLLSRNFSLKTTYTRTGKIDEIFIGKVVDSPEMARKVIDDIGKYHSNKVSPSQVAVAKRQVYKMSMFQDTSCSVRNPENTVYQMLSNDCTGMVGPEICQVQLICSTSTSSCKIGITAS